MNARDEHLVVRATPKLAAHLAGMADADLMAASGLGLPQPQQYEAQRATANEWAPFAARVDNKQRCSYANVPVLIMAELLQRKGQAPTVGEVVYAAVDAGFKARSADWSRTQALKELVGYLQSAKRRGLCELGPARGCPTAPFI